MNVLGVLAGIATLAVTISLSACLGVLGFKITTWLMDRGLTSLSFIVWMTYAFSVLIPSFAGAFVAAYFVASWVSSQ